MASKLLLSCILLLRPILAKPIHQNLEQRQWPGFHGFQGPPGQFDPTITYPFTGPPTGIPTQWGPWGPQSSQSCNTAVWPSEEDVCSDIAALHNVACSPDVGAMAVNSPHCQELLSRNNICVSWSFTASMGASTMTSYSSTSPSPAALSSSSSPITSASFTTNTTITSTTRVASSSSVISTTVSATQTLSNSSTSFTPSSSAAAGSASSASSSSSSPTNSTSSSIASISIPTSSSFTTSRSSAAPTISSSTTSSSSIVITTTSSTPAAASSASPSSSVSPSDKYVSYCGDGSTAAGWPTESQWKSFDYLFNYNTPNMKISCQQWGVPDDSDQEIAEMKASILSVSSETGIDARFILAIIMQESTGCVRVITTAYSHANPGLMQSFNGTGSCNTNNAPSNIPGGGSASGIQTPCPASEIKQMILDGTNGTIWGPGLKQDMVQAEVNAADPAQAYYRTARIYNGGTFVADDLSQPCCTSSYASDVANRLMGWVHAPRTYTCGS